MHDGVNISARAARALRRAIAQGRVEDASALRQEDSSRSRLRQQPGEGFAVAAMLRHPHLIRIFGVNSLPPPPPPLREEPEANLVGGAGGIVTLEAWHPHSLVDRPVIGAVAEWLRTTPRLQRTLILGLQVISAVEYLHSRDAIHGHLHDGNVHLLETLQEGGNPQIVLRCVTSAPMCNCHSCKTDE